MTVTSKRERSGRWAVVAAVGAVLAWGGCSVEKHYAVLSFFFDGVPEPGSESADGESGAGPRFGSGGPQSMHTAYIDRRCSDCHGDRARFGFSTAGFTGLTAAVCVGCHGDVVDRPMLHGPVTVGQCMACHEPHVSPHPALLIETAQTLCLQCHGEEMQHASSPAHADLERSCIDCHDPHGGDDRRFLWPATAPTPDPTPDPDPDPTPDPAPAPGSPAPGAPR